MEKPIPKEWTDGWMNGWMNVLLFDDGTVQPSESSQSVSHNVRLLRILIRHPGKGRISLSFLKCRYKNMPLFFLEA